MKKQSLFCLIIMLLILSACTETRQVSLDSYEVIYANKGLYGAIVYFSDNIKSFSADDKMTFAKSIIRDISSRSKLHNEAVKKIEAHNHFKPTKDYVNYIYPYYFSKDTNEFYVYHYTMSNEIEVRNAVLDIEEDEAFILTKDYYLEDNVYEDFGFSAIIKPELNERLFLVLNTAYHENEYGQYVDSEGERVDIASMSFVPKVINSIKNEPHEKESFTRVIISNDVDLKVLKGHNKITVHMPITINSENPSPNDLTKLVNRFINKYSSYPLTKKEMFKLMTLWYEDDITAIRSNAAAFSFQFNDYNLKVNHSDNYLKSLEIYSDKENDIVDKNIGYLNYYLGHSFSSTINLDKTTIDDKEYYVHTDEDCDITIRVYINLNNIIERIVITKNSFG